MRRGVSMEEKLREFLKRYIGQGEQKKDKVLAEDVEMLVYDACIDGSAQEIIDYGTSHQEASFWELLKLQKPGLYGITQEELLMDDEED